MNNFLIFYNVETVMTVLSISLFILSVKIKKDWFTAVTLISSLIALMNVLVVSADYYDGASVIDIYRAVIGIIVNGLIIIFSTEKLGRIKKGKCRESFLSYKEYRNQQSLYLQTQEHKIHRSESLEQFYLRMYVGYLRINNAGEGLVKVLDEIIDYRLDHYGNMKEGTVLYIREQSVDQSGWDVLKAVDYIIENYKCDEE